MAWDNKALQQTWDNKALQQTWVLNTKYSNNTVVLGEKDIKSALGGEGLIYLKDKVIYKVYPDDKFLPPENKLHELRQLKHPNIIAPTDILVDSVTRKLKGFSMPYKDAYELCMLFPKAFKDRHKITPSQITELVKLMQDANKYLHSQKFLMVDGNEMNYLVSKDFKNIYLIDVNSYQTPSYPAQAIMDSVRDPHSKSFNQNTDWYSWAIVTFQMFIGIHPFKGIYTQNLSMPERMKKNISVFNPDVTIPAVCAPFQIIPSALRDWYEAVFEKGLRTPPPDSYESRIISSPRVTKQIGSDNFIINLLYTYQKPVIMYSNGFTMTENGVYKDDKLMVGLNDVAEIVTTPQGQGILARLNSGKLKLFPILTKVEMPVNFQADEMMSYQGRLYLRNKSDVNEVSFVEFGNKVVSTLKKVGNVIESDTHMFEGCVVSNLSNVCSISMFPKSETCYQLQFSELNNHKILDAKFDNNVLIIVAARAITGEHDKFIFRFAPGFKSYDVRIQESIQVDDINFVVLETGIVLHMTDTGILECFKATYGSKDVVEIDDQAIDTDCILMKNGAQAMFARGEKIYKFSMQQSKAASTSKSSKTRRITRDKNTGKMIDVAQVAKSLIHKDPTYKDIYKDDDMLINTIMGLKPTKKLPNGMI